jgi:hypothetical protein
MQKMSEASRSMTRAKRWDTWEILTLLGLLAVYVGLATYKLHLPGLYYDETLFVGPAAGERPYLKCFGLPLLIFPYIGALKSWVYSPIFAVFGVSPVSIRLPAILISCGTLALGYALARRILTPPWAVAFTGACAVHPGFVLLTRVDLGPVALMLFLKALCLVLLFKWLDSSQKICWSVIGVCILGFFDKFNFIWFIVALALSTSAIYGAEIFRKLRSVPVRVLLPTAAMLLVAGLIVLRIVYPLLRAPHGPVPAGRLSQIWALYESMCTGGATAYLWFKSSPDIPSWMGWGVLTVTAIFLLLTLVTYAFAPRARKNVDTHTLKFCLWCLLMFGVIFLEIVITPQAGGPHHMMMLFPFDLLAAFSAAFLFANAVPGIQRPAVFLEGCLLVVWAASNLKSFEMHFSKFKDLSSFRGRWSPHVELLANYLNKNARNVDSIYTTDWGIGFQLTALCRPDVRRKVKDSWGAFLGWSADRPDAAAETARVFPPGTKSLYITFVPEEAVFPQALQNFERMRSIAGDTVEPLPDVPPEIAETYQIFEKSGVGVGR